MAPWPADAMTNGTDPETGGQSGQRPKRSSGIPGLRPHDVAQPRAMVLEVLRLILLLLRSRAGRHACTRKPQDSEQSLRLEHLSGRCTTRNGLCNKLCHVQLQIRASEKR